MKCKNCNKEFSSVKVIVADVLLENLNTFEGNRIIKVERTNENHEKAYAYQYFCPHCDIPLDNEQTEIIEDMEY